VLSGAKKSNLNFSEKEFKALWFANTAAIGFLSARGMAFTRRRRRTVATQEEEQTQQQNQTMVSRFCNPDRQPQCAYLTTNNSLYIKIQFHVAITNCIACVDGCQKMNSQGGTEYSNLRLSIHEALLLVVNINAYCL
jgi:hypothetical protein